MLTFMRGRQEKVMNSAMSSDSIQLILENLSRDFNDLTAAHTFSVVGLRRISEYFAALPRYPENPDPVIYIGTNPPNNPDTPPYADWRLSEALKQVEPNGAVEIRLGHQWIVFLYELWEHEYRPRLAKVHGRPVGDEKYDLLGDLRHLRNDVVHHHGVATSGNTGRCVLLSHWFQPGDLIRLEGRHHPSSSLR
jgi:hypothetical protein